MFRTVLPDLSIKAIQSVFSFDPLFFFADAFLAAVFFLGLPSGIGTKASTSDRRTNFRPATSML